MTIHVTNLQFCYPEKPESPVLSIPSWSISQGERVFIHGPSGCGKSTLLNLISGMLRPNQGQISVQGERLDTMGAAKRDHFRARHIGYVFQQFNLIPYLSPVENILLGNYFGKRDNAPLKADIEAMLSTLNIEENTWFQACEKLSIGQQQRVAIARALIKNPEILIADEPTSSLDPKNRDNFMSVLMPMLEKQNTTLIVVSHDMFLADFFSRVEHFSELNRDLSNQNSQFTHEAR